MIANLIDSSCARDPYGLSRRARAMFGAIALGQIGKVRFDGAFHGLPFSQDGLQFTGDCGSMSGLQQVVMVAGHLLDL
jgi:hypothetical protein